MANGDLSAMAKEVAKMGEKVRLTDRDLRVLRHLVVQRFPIRLYSRDRRTGWRLVDRGLAKVDVIGEYHLDHFSATDAGRNTIAALANKDPTP